MYRTVPVILAVVIITAMIGVSVPLEQAFASSAAAAAAGDSSAAAAASSDDDDDCDKDWEDCHEEGD
jgi:ribosomal protein L12E/L44/L45/RPP1/RPP2